MSAPFTRRWLFVNVILVPIPFLLVWANEYAAWWPRGDYYILTYMFALFVAPLVLSATNLVIWLTCLLLLKCGLKSTFDLAQPMQAAFVSFGITGLMSLITCAGNWVLFTF